MESEAEVFPRGSADSVHLVAVPSVLTADRKIGPDSVTGSTCPLPPDPQPEGRRREGRGETPAGPLGLSLTQQCPDQSQLLGEPQGSECPTQHLENEFGARCAGVSSQEPAGTSWHHSHLFLRTVMIVNITSQLQLRGRHFGSLNLAVSGILKPRNQQTL